MGWDVSLLERQEDGTSPDRNTSIGTTTCLPIEQDSVGLCHPTFLLFYLLFCFVFLCLLLHFSSICSKNMLNKCFMIAAKPGTQTSSSKTHVWQGWEGILGGSPLVPVSVAGPGLLLFPQGPWCSPLPTIPHTHCLLSRQGFTLNPSH